MPGRWACGPLHISMVQSTGLWLASSTARSPIAIAVLIGAPVNSSSRDHCTRMVLPGIRIAMTDGVERGVVGGVVPVAPAPWRWNTVTCAAGSPSARASQSTLQSTQALRMRPDRELAILELRHRAGRPIDACVERAGCRSPRRRARSGAAEVSALDHAVARRLVFTTLARRIVGHWMPPSQTPCARAASAARIARSRPPRTATKLPSRSISTGALAARRTACSSTDTRRAPRQGCRTTRACRSRPAP